MQKKYTDEFGGSTVIEIVLTLKNITQEHATKRQLFNLLQYPIYEYKEIDGDPTYI